MYKSRMAKIEEELMRLQEGNLETPIKVEGMGVYHAITKRMETLRLIMLKMRDNEVETAKRLNTAVASVAHDMKTPLSIISGYAECIGDGIDDRDYPALILQKIDQMNDMVLALVEESQNMLEGQQAEHTAITNTKVYFAEAFKRLQPLAESKGISLKIKKIPSANVRLNSKQFGRVVQNLVSNAVKYSPAGSTVEVSFNLWAKTFLFYVKDHGDGIAKENLPFIFDQFYKEDKSRGDTSSNGLGLYITKEIVRQHGGKIRVVSKKGKGSTFIVSLPIEPDLDDKATLTDRFNRLHLWQKIIFELFFGWIFASFYRVVRFFETRNLSTLVFGLLCVALFPFMWLIDFLSICVYGKINFLAD